MFKNIYIGLLVLAISACATQYTPTVDSSDDFNFMTMQSFNLVGDSLLKNTMLSDIDRERINSAIKNELVGKGKFEAENSDMLVSFFIIAKEKTKVTSTGSVGYAGGYYGRGRYGYNAGMSNVSTRNYVEGTLVIDIIDATTNKVVWRSSLKKPLKKMENPQERTTAINEAVNSMLMDLR